MIKILPQHLAERIEPTNRPNLVSLIPGWTDFYPKRDAVRIIIQDILLRSNTARGKGRNAKRRYQAICDAKERAWEESQIYMTGYEDGLRDAHDPNLPPAIHKLAQQYRARIHGAPAKEVFGVVKPTHADRRTFLHIDSTGQRLEEF